MDNLPYIDKKRTGENLKRLMRLKRITISQMQLKLGMASGTIIYAWCRGDRVPSPDHLVQLAYILDCDLSELIITEVPENE